MVLWPFINCVAHSGCKVCNGCNRGACQNTQILVPFNWPHRRRCSKLPTEMCPCYLVTLMNLTKTCIMTLRNVYILCHFGYMSMLVSIRAVVKSANALYVRGESSNCQKGRCTSVNSECHLWQQKLYIKTF